MNYVRVYVVTEATEVVMALVIAASNAVMSAAERVGLLSLLLSSVALFFFAAARVFVESKTILQSL